MIPSIEDVAIEFEEGKSKDYRLDVESRRITGFVDGIEAVKQAIYKILNTERYESIIYSWDYGTETRDLIGEPYDYVCAELKRLIEEALKQDDRVESVDSFEFTQGRNKVLVSFTAHTVFGSIDAEKEVDL